MPFVNITIYEGHGKDRKDEIARRVTDTITDVCKLCLLYTSPSPRDKRQSRMPSSA